MKAQYKSRNDGIISHPHSPVEVEFYDNFILVHQDYDAPTVQDKQQLDALIEMLQLVKKVKGW